MRAKNMQVLTNQIKAKKPGVTIWGIGDKAHKLETSGHNEDDTPGVKAEDQDSDNVREHRAIDVKLDGSFTRGDAVQLVADLVGKKTNQARLLYVIFERQIWSRSRGWAVRAYTGKNPHTTHVHVSGEADDDENESQWDLSGTPSQPAPSNQLAVDGELGPKTIRRWQEVMGTPTDGVITPKNSDLVRAVQRKLKSTVKPNLVVDGDGIYQNGKSSKTIAALQTYLQVPVDGFLSVPVSNTVKALQRRLNAGQF